VPQRNRLSNVQVDHLKAIAGTYTPDLHDPAAVEVLLVLLEVCRILDLSESRLEAIFSPRYLYALTTWGDVVPPKQRPARLQRAWVWLPNQYAPKLHPIGDDG
jgi:hypothetical protein